MQFPKYLHLPNTMHHHPCPLPINPPPPPPACAPRLLVWSIKLTVNFSHLMLCEVCRVSRSQPSPEHITNCVKAMDKLHTWDHTGMVHRENHQDQKEGDCRQNATMTHFGLSKQLYGVWSRKKKCQHFAVDALQAKGHLATRQDTPGSWLALNTRPPRRHGLAGEILRVTSWQANTNN